MAKQVIILRTAKGPGGDDDVEFVYWIPVVAARRVPIAGAVSVWSGAAAGDNTKIQSGEILEIKDRCQFPAVMTSAQIKADLEARWAAKKAEIDAMPNPNRFFGVFWDPAVTANNGWSA